MTVKFSWTSCMCRNWFYCLYIWKHLPISLGIFCISWSVFWIVKTSRTPFPENIKIDYFVLVMSLHKIISTFLYVWIKKVSCRMLWSHKCKATGGYLQWRDDVPFETTCRKLSVSLKVGMATEAGLFFYSGTYRWTISALLWNPERTRV